MTKRRGIIAIVLLCLLQVSALLGSFSANYWSQKQALFEIKQRVSLDISTLDLGTENSDSVANIDDVIRYIDNVNEYLTLNEFPIRIQSINGINSSNVSRNFSHSNLQKLSANDKDVTITMLSKSVFDGFSISYLSFLVGLLYFFYPKITRYYTQIEDSEKNTLPPPLTVTSSIILMIDLRTKSFYLEGSDTPIILSNKPFCFYVALVKYCLSCGNEKLIHHDPIPLELLEYADNTFKKLMDLGHTKRRQPNFASNLDKTLSEIRAALDQVFEKYPLEKSPFYPPKAQGEGSRTKRHSYALEDLQTDALKFIFD